MESNPSSRRHRHLAARRHGSPDEEPVPQSGRRRTQAPAAKPGPVRWILLWLIPSALLSPLLWCDLLWTDFDTVERTDYQAYSISETLFSRAALANQDPVAALSYHLEDRLGALTPAWHRGLNIGLHLLNASLLLLFLQRLGMPWAWWAALLFAIHPAIVQPVFWPGYRATLTGFFALFVALNVATRYRTGFGLAVALILTAGAAIVHPIGLTIPLLLALLEQTKSIHLEFRQFNRVLPFAAVALTIGLWIYGARDAPEASTLSAFEQAAQNTNFYLKQSLFPIQPELFYPYQAFIGNAPRGLINTLPFLIFGPLFVVVAIRFKRVSSRFILLAIGAILVLMSAGMFVRGAALDGTIAFEDRGLYFALAALTASVVAGLHAASVAVRSMAVLAIGTGLVSCLSMTALHSYSLRSEQSVWTRIDKTWPEAWTSKAALAHYFMAREHSGDDQDLFIRSLEQALELRPDQTAMRRTLAEAYVERNRPRDALVQYLRILSVRPDDIDSLEQSARIYERINLHTELNNTYRRLLEIDPDNTLALLGMSERDLANREFGTAKTRLKKLLELAPDNKEALEMYATALLQSGEHRAALDLLERIQDDNPRAAMVMMKIAQVVGFDELEDARQTAEKALQIQPENPLINAGYAEFLIIHLSDDPESVQKAISHARYAHELTQRSDPRIEALLGDVYRSAGDLEAALETYRTARSKATNLEMTTLATALTKQINSLELALSE